MNKWAKLTREQRIKAIRDGVARGLSASQIAAEFDGCTKGSVIGLADRNGIQLNSRRKQSEVAPKNFGGNRLKPVWGSMTADEKAEYVIKNAALGLTYRQISHTVIGATHEAIRGAAKRVRAKIKAPKGKAATSPAKSLFGPPKRAAAYDKVVNIMDLDREHCRAPRWADRPKRPLRSPDDWVYCGKKVKDGSSYCEACHEKFWIKPDRRMRYDRRYMAR